MPLEDFERFRQLVLEDATLQQALSETADTRAFIELARRLGAERGCHFTAEDLHEAMRTARRAWRERWI